MYVHEASLEVRYYETDLMGIVHHSNYIRYFEYGRNRALVDLGFPIKEVEQRGVMMPVIEVNCFYKLPTYQGDILKIVSTIKELPKVKLKIDTVIYNPAGEVASYGSVVLGFINSTTRRAIRAPKFVIDLFEPYIEQSK
ncbi:MAG: thioesterase family protein [Bacteroidales bacterium]